MLRVKKELKVKKKQMKKAKKLKVLKAKEKKSPSQKASKLEKPTQKQLIIIGAVIFSITVALILIFFHEQIWPDFIANRQDNDKQQHIEPQDGNLVEDEIKARHPLTGEPIAEEIDRPAVYGVMIENMVEAWPLSGVDQAFLVIEAPVEAAIPRFLAFYYQDQEVDKIGPVRSARPYYLDWAQGLEAMYVHVGGSPAALTEISEQNMFDLNEFYRGWYFWRSSSRSAPHNVYTSSDLLIDAYEEESAWRTMSDLEYGLWDYKVDLPKSERPESHMVSMNFSPYYGDLYSAGWEYDPETNEYLRYQSGYEMSMLDGADIKASNIAVVETDIVVIDEIGRRQIITIGEGDALVFQDGETIEAIWSKDSEQDRLRFYNKNTSEEILWNAGVTWIEVLGSLESVVVD
jgi:hypothetical protein